VMQSGNLVPMPIQNLFFKAISFAFILWEEIVVDMGGIWSNMGSGIR